MIVRIRRRDGVVQRYRVRNTWAEIREDLEKRKALQKRSVLDKVKERSSLKYENEKEINEYLRQIPPEELLKEIGYKKRKRELPDWMKEAFIKGEAKSVEQQRKENAAREEAERIRHEAFEAWWQSYIKSEEFQRWKRAEEHKREQERLEKSIGAPLEKHELPEAIREFNRLQTKKDLTPEEKISLHVLTTRLKNRRRRWI